MPCRAIEGFQRMDGWGPAHDSRRFLLINLYVLLSVLLTWIAPVFYREGRDHADLRLSGKHGLGCWLHSLLVTRYSRPRGIG